MGRSEAENDLFRRTITVEFWVGVFVLIGLGALAYLSINIARMRFINAGYYEVVAEFDNVSGLEVGAAVEIAGVGIGSVKSIDLKDTTAVVKFDILNSVKLREDDIASIRTKGIIGDRYVRVSPGGSDAMIADGGRMYETESAVDFEDIIGKLIHRME